jgi:biopolymer transport protein ExbB/TolQ
MLEMLQKGGPFMIPLAIASLVALALIFDRLFHLYIRYSINAPRLLDEVSRRAEVGDFRGALQVLTGQGKHPLAEVMRAGLLKADRSDREIQRSMEEAMVRHTPVVTKRTNYLSMIANVATLMGLLGTIQGLISCFAGVADASAAEKQAVLAQGISVAMFTTFSGLIVAIPCLVAYTIFFNKEQAMLTSIEESAITLFNRIAERNRDHAAGRDSSHIRVA